MHQVLLGSGRGNLWQTTSVVEQLVSRMTELRDDLVLLHHMIVGALNNGDANVGLFAIQHTGLNGIATISKGQAKDLRLQDVSSVILRCIVIKISLTVQGGPIRKHSTIQLSLTQGTTQGLDKGDHSLLLGFLGPDIFLGQDQSRLEGQNLFGGLG